jgi:hypothetical protein
MMKILMKKMINSKTLIKRMTMLILKKFKKVMNIKIIILKILIEKIMRMKI